MLETSSAGCCCQLPGFNPRRVSLWLSRSPTRGCSRCWVPPMQDWCIVTGTRHVQRRGVKLDASLELCGEEEDGFPDVLPADWG